MTAVSLPSAPPPSPAYVKPDAEPAGDGISGKSKFQDVLGNADDDGKDTKTDTDQPKKEERLTQSVVVAIFAAMSPAAPPASFGAPSEGDEAGPTSKTGNTPAAEAKTEMPVTLPVPGVAPTDKPHTDLKLDLAFALRLVDLTPGQESASTSQAQSVKTALDLTPEFGKGQVDPSGRSSAITSSSLVESASNQAGGFASTTSDSGAGKGGSNEPPKPDRAKLVAQSDPAADSAPVRHAGAEAAIGGAVPKESPQQLAGPTPLAARQSTSGARAPEIAERAAVATPAEPSAPAGPPLGTRSTTQVTDVSVNIPASRGDSGVDDRIAIRMIQRGGEIHVAVRTPDQQATQALRQDLSRLGSSLDEAGFRADTWRPTSAHVAAPSEAHGQRDFSRETAQHDSSGSDSHPGGQKGRNPGEQKRRQQEDRPRWVAELEKQRD